MYTSEEYYTLKAGYLLTWTDEELADRKQTLLLSPPSEMRTCQFHDIDEEQDVRAYYRENPSPTREEFGARNRLLFS